MSESGLHAYCAAGREAWARAALALLGGEPADVRVHQWLSGEEIVFVNRSSSLAAQWLAAYGNAGGDGDGLAGNQPDRS